MNTKIIISILAFLFDSNNHDKAVELVRILPLAEKREFDIPVVHRASSSRKETSWRLSGTHSHWIVSLVLSEHME